MRGGSNPACGREGRLSVRLPQIAHAWPGYPSGQIFTPSPNAGPVQLSYNCRCWRLVQAKLAQVTKKSRRPGCRA